MPHASTSQFFDGIRAARLLDETRIKELEARPEAVWGDIISLSKYAQDQGWVTAYQAIELREGRGNRLNVAGYQIFDKLDDGPFGTTYKALHPAVQQPVSLRVLNVDWLSPSDTASEYIARVQTASLVQSPYFANVLAAGTFEQLPFVVQEYVDGCDLYRMVNEMGALPVPLACEYVRQAAVAIQLAHEKGATHGDVSPHNLLLAPVKRVVGSNGDVSIRPRPGANVKLVEFGLTPRRPPIGDLTFGESDRLGMLSFLPPERLTSGERTQAGDLYGLGASLYFLLSTRPPHAGDKTLEVMLNIQQGEPAPLASLRAETPGPVAELVGRLLSRYPTQRPSAGEIVEKLTPHSEVIAAPAVAPVLVASETFTLPGVPTAVPVARDLDRIAEPEVEEPFAEEIPPSVDSAPLVEPLPDDHSHHDHHGLTPEVHPLDDHHDTGHQVEFEHTAMGADKPKAPRPKAQLSQKNKIMIAVGLTLHLIATTMCLGYMGVIPNPFSKPTTDDVQPGGDKTTTTTTKKAKGKKG